MAAGSCEKRDDIGYCQAGKIYLWNVSTQQSIGELLGHTRQVLNLTFSPDGRMLASGSYGTILLWDIKTRQSIQVPMSMEGEIRVAFSQNSETMLMWNDEYFQWWDVSIGPKTGVADQPFREEKNPANNVSSVVFTPTGNVLGAGNLEDAIGLWDFAAPDQIEVKGAPLLSATFSPDSSILASGDQDGKILLWDVAARHVLGELSIDGYFGVQSLSFSPDGSILASGNLDGIIRLWNVGTRQLIGELRGHDGVVWKVAFSWDGKILASAGQDGTIRLWDVASALNTSLEIKEPLAVLPGHVSDVVSVAFSRDNKTLASGGFDNTIRLWDVEKKQLIGTLNGHTDDVPSVTFSPDGKTLASGSSDYTLRLWDVSTQKQIGEMRASGWAVSYSSDGKVLASGGQDGTIQLWDVGTRQLIAKVQKSSDVMTSVLFSPNGKKLASWDHWGSGIYLWDMEAQPWLESSCKIVNRNLTRAEYAQYINRDASAYDNEYAKHPTCEGLSVEPLPTPTPKASPTP